MSLLEVRDLRKSFRRHFWSEKTEVLKGVSFKVEPGKVTGFLGANGAGKTTTMKCLLGLIFPDSGEFSYFGSSSLTSEVKSRIGFLPERPYFYSYLTGQEFLKFYGLISSKIKKNLLQDRIESLLKRVDLYHAKDLALRYYSKGMLQKIGFAQAMIHDPDLLILDEPMSGLDPDGRYYLSELIREASSEGRSVLLSSHLLHDTEQLCADLIILKDGVLFYQGATRALLSSLEPNYQVAYLTGGDRKKLSGLSQEAMQEKISLIIRDGGKIVGVEPDRISLEQYFISKVLGRRNESHLDYS